MCSTALDQLFRRLRSIQYGRLEHGRLDYGMNNQICKLYIVTQKNKLVMSLLSAENYKMMRGKECLNEELINLHQTQ